jgi:Pro-kumamolisin, activation domain/IPT/TIG domain
MDERERRGRRTGEGLASVFRRGRGRVARHRWIALSVPALLALAVSAVIGAGAASGQGGLVRIGAAPSIPSGAVDLGAAPASAEESGTVVLRPRNEQALEGFIERVTSKGSPEFGQYLKKGQFAERFGPEQATVEAVSSQLRADGLQVSHATGNDLLVGFSGTAAHVSSAFATTLHSYRLGSGRLVHASTSAPALPKALAGSVVAVEGLDGLQQTRPKRVHRSAALASHFAAARSVSFKHPAGSPDACTKARSAANQLGGLTDDQIAYAYGAFGLYGVGDTGSGVHIGVFEEESFSRSDMQRFDTCYFGAAGAAGMMERLHVVSLEGGIPEGPGLYGEALLDIEDVSAMAPGAEIDVYENPESPAGEVAEIAAMVDEDRDQIVTSSYGQPCEEEEEEGQPGTEEALNFLFQQGAAQGQTFLGAAGDSGSDNCEEVHRETVIQHDQNPLSGGEIASQPYVLAVGGTTITDATQPAQEHVWNDGDEGGAGGGGISRAFAMPSWQFASSVPGIDRPGSADYENAASVERSFGYPTGFCDEALTGASPSTPCRLDPDVSAQSDEYTGAVTVYSEEYEGEGEEASPSGWITSGGTSSATPIWAGLLALADASPTCRSNPATAAGVGFVTPLLYAIASNPTDYAAAFNDITEGNNDQYGLDDGKVYPARKGFDLASGLGSPRMTDAEGSAGLAYYLCSFAAPTNRPAVTALSPSFGPTAGGETVKVTGAGFESAGKPYVSGVQVGTWQVPASSIDVTGTESLTLTMPPASDTLPADSPAPQDGAGPANIVVSLDNGQSSATGPAARFQYVDTVGSTPIPGVTGMVPTGGSETAPAPVTILGSDFDGATSVSFGGVKASSFEVLSDSQILVTPPAYSSKKTACAQLPNSGVYAGENAANDLCQVQVVVHGAAGASATSTILPPVQGGAVFEQNGALESPPECGCEVYPAPSEYDYAPAPKITSVSTSAGPASLASETGGTLVTVHGVGLDRFSFLYANFGDPTEEASIEGGPAPYWQSPSYMTGTEIQIEAPALVGEEEAPTVGPETIPLSVRTLAGSSPESSVEYAGVPTVSSVESTASSVRLKGHSGAADTGGTPIVLQGDGLAGQLTRVQFIEEPEELSEGTQYTFTAEGETRLRTQTVSENPGLLDVRACTVTGCSATSASDRLYLYPAGQPAVDALSPSSGPAAGGTQVKVSGQNLGCPLTVRFGGKRSKTVTEIPALLACGSTAALHAVSPHGKAGKSVPVTVTTWESYFTSTGDAPSQARFTYAAP